MEDTIKTPPCLKLDEGHVLTRISHYPPETRDEVAWLAAVTRERCNGQITILKEKAKAAGEPCDYSYLHKILSGKYFGVNPKTRKIMGSVDNFLQFIEKMRRHIEIEWRAGRTPFVETESYQMVRDFLDALRERERVNRFGGILGPTGSSKSASCDYYCMMNNHGRSINIEAPEKASLGQFIRDLAAKYGFNRSESNTRQRAQIRQVVNEHRLIIIQNIQQLYLKERGDDQPILSYLRKLQDETGCVIAMTFTSDFLRTLRAGTGGYLEQFIGRMGGLRKVLQLPEYPPREDVLAIAQSFGLADAKKHAQYLELIVKQPGRIRILFEDLQEAKKLAGKEALTIEHLRIVREEEEGA